MTDRWGIVGLGGSHAPATEVPTGADTFATTDNQTKEPTSPGSIDLGIAVDKRVRSAPVGPRLNNVYECLTFIQQSSRYPDDAVVKRAVKLLRG